MSTLNSQYQKIYVINLDHRTDRLSKMKLLLDKHNIKYIRFPAINGKRPDIFNHWYQKVISTKHCKIKSPGAFGYLLSFFYILQDAIFNKYQQILVLDDDVKFHVNFNDYINDIVFPKKWKLIYYGACHQNHQSHHQSLQKSRSLSYNVFEFQKIFGKGNIDGSHMVGIHSSIYNELCMLIKKSIYPLDSGPLRSIYKNYSQECFVVYPYLAIQDLSESDIQDNIPVNYSQYFYKKWGWNLGEYA
tara:strand:- start:259 stop:993 length:735 start_codon:yes stop_codon:yes gene_type:complete